MFKLLSLSCETFTDPTDHAQAGVTSAGPCVSGENKERFCRWYCRPQHRQRRRGSSLSPLRLHFPTDQRGGRSRSGGHGAQGGGGGSVDGGGALSLSVHADLAPLWVQWLWM